MEFLKNTSIIRLIRRAGVKSLSKNSFILIKKLIHQKLEEIINISLKYNSSHNKKIISPTDLYKTFELSGYNVSELNINNTKYSFEVYINKLLKQSFLTNEITYNAKSQLNSVLLCICRHILKSIDKKTINNKDVICVLNTILSGELLKNCIIEGEKAVNNFTNFVKNYGDDNVNKMRFSKQEKSNIIFSPSIINKIFKNEIKISNSAKIFISAVLEYLTFEIIDLSIIFCKDDKRSRITIRDIEIAIKTDNELNKMFNKLNIILLGGGVIPTIENISINQVNKKIIKIIKKEQENNNLILSKTLFQKLVRSIYNNKKINKEVFEILQYFIEQYTIDILQKANYITINSNRIRLIPNDINIVYFIKNNFLPDFKIVIPNNVTTQHNHFEYLFEINDDNEYTDEDEYIDIEDESAYTEDSDIGLDISGI